MTKCPLDTKRDKTHHFFEQIHFFLRDPKVCPGCAVVREERSRSNFLADQFQGQVAVNGDQHRKLELLLILQHIRARRTDVLHPPVFFGMSKGRVASFVVRCIHVPRRSGTSVTCVLVCLSVSPLTVDVFCPVGTRCQL